jgi:tetratricopeptide (TPR) repeat protein
MCQTFCRRFLWLFLLTAVPGLQTGRAADKWLRVRSKNFLLIGNGSESSIRKVGRNLEEFRAGFTTLFPALGQKASLPITVVVFKDDTSFRPFKPLYKGKPASLAGFFQAGQDVNFIALTGDSETPQVIFHEFVHFMTRDSAVPLPPWASEGLAEFYSMSRIEANSKEILIGQPMSNHIATLRQTFLGLNALFAVDHKSPYYNEQTKQGIFYAESWATIHYLMLGDNARRRPQLVKFLSLLGEGKPTDESFREAFQADYAVLEKEMQEYVEHPAFPIVRVTLQNKIDFDREMQVAALTEAQAQYYLGDYLMHIGRLDTAETQLQKAISLDASFGPSYASMGMLRIRQEKPDDALKFLTQAAQYDSANYMTHYYYAFMLQNSGDNASKDSKSRFALMSEHLKKSIELAPDYLPAYDLLGYVALVSAEDLPQTEDILKKGLTAAPGRKDLRLRLGEVMFMNKEPLAARVVLSSLKGLPDDDATGRQARTLLDQIQSGIDNAAAVREYEERMRAAGVQALKTSPELPDDPGPDKPPVLTRGQTKDTSGGLVETAAPKLTRPAGLQVEGALTVVDCSQGLTLRVRVGNEVVALHSDDPSTIQFMSYTTGVSDSIACGTLKPEPQVLIVYRRGADPKFLGEPIRVEFVEKK